MEWNNYIRLNFILFFIQLKIVSWTILSIFLFNHNSYAQFIDFQSDEFLKESKDSIVKKRNLILVSSGWSDSLMDLFKQGKNSYNQRRSFASPYLFMIRYTHQGGSGKLYFLTTILIPKYYREYLFSLATNLREQEAKKAFDDFESKHVEIVQFFPQDFSKNRNKNLIIKLKKTFLELRKNQHQHNTFLGLDAHSTFPELEYLAEEWDLPLLTNFPALDYLGNKSGNRMTYEEGHIAYPVGHNSPIKSVEDLASTILSMKDQFKNNKVMVKLIKASSGKGNLLINLNDREIFGDNRSPDKQYQDEQNEQYHEQYTEELKNKIIKYIKSKSPGYLKKIEEEGAIIESYIEGENLRSPSSTFLITSQENVKIIFTNDQILGGENNQSYQGALVHKKSKKIKEGSDLDLLYKLTLKIGQTLLNKGVQGYVSSDFVLCDKNLDDHHEDKRTEIFAIENNIRHGATLYPYLSAQSLLGEDLLKRRYLLSLKEINFKAHPSPIEQMNRMKKYYQWAINHPYSLNLEKGEGFFIHQDNADYGKISISIVAKHKRTLEKIKRNLEEVNFGLLIF